MTGIKPISAPVITGIIGRGNPEDCKNCGGLNTIGECSIPYIGNPDTWKAFGSMVLAGRPNYPYRYDGPDGIYEMMTDTVFLQMKEEVELISSSRSAALRYTRTLRPRRKAVPIQFSIRL